MSAIGQQLPRTEEVVTITVHHHTAAVATATVEAASKPAIHLHTHTDASDALQLNARNAMPISIITTIRPVLNDSSYRFHHSQSVSILIHECFLTHSTYLNVLVPPIVPFGLPGPIGFPGPLGFPGLPGPIGVPPM